VHEVGEAEVGHARLAGGVDEDVRGLEVAVDDALGVRVRERLGDAREDAHALAEVEPLHGVRERAAFDELHDEVGEAVDVARVVDGDDARVAEARGGMGLAPEALDDLGLVLVRAAENLHGDGPVELAVAAAIDDGHRAAPDLRLEDVRPQLSRGLSRHAGSIAFSATPRCGGGSGRAA
jgi:hypothetical protein